MNSASSGVISIFDTNNIYSNDYAYVEALAETMKNEYN